MTVVISGFRADLVGQMFDELRRFFRCSSTAAEDEWREHALLNLHDSGIVLPLLLFLSLGVHGWYLFLPISMGPLHKKMPKYQLPNLTP